MALQEAANLDAMPGTAYEESRMCICLWPGRHRPLRACDGRAVAATIQLRPLLSSGTAPSASTPRPASAPAFTYSRLATSRYRLQAQKTSGSHG